MHAGWDADGDDHRPRNFSGTMRGHLTGYQKDEDGRVRWSLETREGAPYSGVEILMPSGVMTAPRIGDNVEVVVLDLHGDGAHLLAIPIGDSTKQIRLEPGEAAIANPENPGQYVKMKADGSIEINSDQPVTITSPAGITLRGPITIDGDINQTGSITSSGAHVASAHI